MFMYIIRIFFLLFILSLTQPACTSPKNPPNAILTGRATKIVDGDTFDLLTSDNTTYRIRLHGIDCPERGMDYYKVCKTALGDLCQGQQLKVIVRDKDRYKRTVGDIYTADGKWINLELIAGGFAWHFTRYDNDPRMKVAEEKARGAKLGLWAMKDPTPPWEWRQERRKKKVP